LPVRQLKLAGVHVQVSTENPANGGVPSILLFLPVRNSDDTLERVRIGWERKGLSRLTSLAAREKKVSPD
jgi:hypothetical protein